MPTRDSGPKSDGVTADPVHAARMRPAGTVLTYGNVVRSFPTLRQRAETLLVGWGAWIRTRGWRNQNPLPYHLATPQRGGWRPV